MICSSLPRVYNLLVFDVVQIAGLARASDAPHSAEKKREGEMRIGIRRAPFTVS